MGCGTVLLAALRTLAALVALGVVGLGAWVIHLIHDINARGGSALDQVLLDQGKEDIWEDFFDAATGSEMRIWVAIAAGSFSFLVATFIIISLKSQRLKISHYLLIPLELLCMLAMAAAFATTLTLAVKLDTCCPALDVSANSDLMMFGMLCPLSKAHSITGGAGLFLLVVTSLAAVIHLCATAHAKKSCDFEPTASALGMGHDYSAVKPVARRSTIPTMYDPFKSKSFVKSKSTDASAAKIVDGRLADEEKVLAGAAAGMGRRDSGISERERNKELDFDLEKGEEVQEVISGPLGLERPEKVKQSARPAHRPWSEMPKKK
ncbi:hypothetical protein BCR34DRAFT_143623 [Clohesyomyces aquaticus]|uniref:Uncharacterized protein n=1 Tax=Clohesyomyces aquaticus TaxID=1231657 RepID=A0A1Y2A1R4_9PLEO|nr:hypothetical protein BCR34DRAFT_143623 [Clohesyomyces aquaticus]